MIEGNEILSKIFIELAPESFVSRLVVSLNPTQSITLTLLFIAAKPWIKPRNHVWWAGKDVD